MPSTMTEQELEKEATSAALRAIAGTPDEYGYQLFTFTRDGNPGEPDPELVARAATRAVLSRLKELGKLKD
jgi:hypothetical protein